MSVIQHRRSATPGAVPSSLLAGEIGINEADGKLYFLDTGVVTAKRLVEMRTLIVRGTVAAAASLTVNIDPAVIGTWSKFEIFLSEIRPVTDGANLLLRVGDSGGIKSGASDYKITWLGLLNSMVSGDSDSAFGTAGSSINLTVDSGIGNAAGEGGLIWLQLSTNDPNYSSTTKIIFMTSNLDSSTRQISQFGAGEYVTAAIDLTQIQFLFSSGNISTCRYAVMGIP